MLLVWSNGPNGIACRCIGETSFVEEIDEDTEESRLCVSTIVNLTFLIHRDVFADSIRVNLDESEAVDEEKRRMGYLKPFSDMRSMCRLDRDAVRIVERFAGRQ